MNENNTPPVARALLPLRRFYYNNNTYSVGRANNNNMKESAAARAYAFNNRRGRTRKIRRRRRRVPVYDSGRADALRPFRVGGGDGAFFTVACQIIDPLARAVAVKARSETTAALTFPGVFARTPFIIDRRLNRAALSPPGPSRENTTVSLRRRLRACVYFDGDGRSRAIAPI